MIEHFLIMALASWLAHTFGGLHEDNQGNQVGHERCANQNTKSKNQTKTTK